MRVRQILLKLGGLLFAVCSLALGQDATSQLTNFTVSPTSFSTSTADAIISFCVSATDNVSGIAHGFVRADSPTSMPVSGFGVVSSNFQGVLSGTQCASFIVPVGSLFESEPVVVGAGRAVWGLRCATT